MRIFMCFAICALCISPAFAGNPIVRGIVFTGKGKTAVDTEKVKIVLTNAKNFFEWEMRNQVKSPTTFNLEECEGAGFEIDEIVDVGRNFSDYPDFTSFAAVIDEKSPELSEFGEVRVVFLSGETDLGEDILGRHQPRCSGPNQCEGYIFIPADVDADMSLIVAHELGHAFGLGHQRSGKLLMYKDVAGRTLYKTHLSEDEARWLQCNKFFTNNQPVLSTPGIDDIHLPEQFARNLNMRTSVKIRIDFSNTFRLHQVYLTHAIDGRVLDYAYFSEENPFTATFDVKTRDLRETTRIWVRILDSVGNYVYYHNVDLSDYDVDARQNRDRAAPSLLMRGTVGKWGDLKAK